MIQQGAQLLQQALERSGRGVVLLSRDGRIRLISPRAQGWLAEYFGRPGREDGRLPEPLRSFIQQEDALLSSTDAGPLSREPLRVQRDRKCLLILHLCDAERCLLMLEERQTTPEPAPFESYALTKREAEVLHWVVQGKTNAEIGMILSVSPRTVQKHLEHIFKKLGVETRAAATLAPGWRSGA